MNFDDVYLTTMETYFAAVRPADWKAAINAVVTETGLKALTFGARDVTAALDNIREAVAFYTATEATITPIVLDGEKAYRVTAAGYRMGPVGDH